MKQDNTHLKLLLEINEGITTIRSKDDLFAFVSKKLKSRFRFDDAVIAQVHQNQTHSAFLLCVSDRTRSQPGFNQVAGDVFPIEDGIADRILSSEVPLIMDIEEERKSNPGLGYLDFLHQVGLKEMLGMALRYGNEAKGILYLQSRKLGSFSKDQFELFLSLGNQLAVALSNIIANELLRKKEQEKSLQLAVNNALLTIQDQDLLCVTVAEEIDKAVPCDTFTLQISEKQNIQNLYFFRKQPDNIFKNVLEGMRNQNGDLEKHQMDDLTSAEESAVIFTGNSFQEIQKRYKSLQRASVDDGINAIMQVAFSLEAREQLNVLITMGSKSSQGFEKDDLEIIRHLTPQISLALENQIAFQEIKELKEELEREKNYLSEEIKTDHNFEEIIGSSPALHEVFLKVSQVAHTETTVLVEGETGTGKELIARAIHNLSERNEKLLVKVNCATLPSQLIESELFGHQKGSFTGAIESRVGKFEMAQGGTIFLDEIGEIPLELQPKLLRVLQEREIERIGGRKPIKVDVRIIAATNRDLEKEVAAGNFRADLYYRLNVFPLTLPSLRERREDIPLLIDHFLKKISKRLGKKITGISQASQKQMMEYSWPGNIRELEHVLERVSILAQSPVLEFDLDKKTEYSVGYGKPVPTSLKPLDEVERNHILGILEYTSGRIRGKQGAAEILDVKPTTLEARMKRLGIQKGHFHKER